ncbi:hypothetical protein HK097_004680, partial [Rhizophlyctis rosea]
ELPQQMMQYPTPDSGATTAVREGGDVGSLGYFGIQVERDGFGCAAAPAPQEFTGFGGPYNLGGYYSY